jgi:hypothetical protein
MATTEDAVLDRVRDVVADLGYRETTGFDFAKTPAGALDKAFVASLTTVAPVGGMTFSEEARGLVTVQVARGIDQGYQTARRTLWQDARDIVSAIVRDGAVTSGEYAVDDARRVLNLDAPRGAAYLVLTVALPVSFEATL